jgi:hypothetical protein
MAVQKKKRVKHAGTKVYGETIRQPDTNSRHAQRPFQGFLQRAITIIAVIQKDERSKKKTPIKNKSNKIQL